MTNDLIVRLRAQFDEDEAWAKAASAPYPYAAEGTMTPPGGVHWEWVTGDWWEPIAPDPVAEEFVADGDPVWLASREKWPGRDPASQPMPATASEAIQEMRTGHAGHIARHDPARVLREVAAKRAILDAAEFLQSWTHDDAQGVAADLLHQLALPYQPHCHPIG